MKNKLNILNIVLSKAIMIGVTVLCCSINSIAQAPDWSLNPADFQITMTGVMTVSEDCVPSADAGDLIGVFDLTGQLRGVKATNIDNQAFITIYGNTPNEELVFKVYDAGTNTVHNIYGQSILLVEGLKTGNPVEPYDLVYDGPITNNNGGPDQEIFNQNATSLEAIGAGTWSIIFGVGGTFSNNTDPQATFTGTIGISYTLVWTQSSGDCNGSSDEVIIHLVKDEPEIGAGNCSDGLDNDGDGLTDCMDDDCGKPTFSDIVTSLPSPIDCQTSTADGTITFVAANATQFSINAGTDLQTAQTFNNLSSGVYELWAQNSTTGCIGTATVDMDVLVDPLDGVSIAIDGPDMLCRGLDDVSFSMNSSSAVNLNSNWSYSGTGANITTTGNNIEVDFTSTATAGKLYVELSSSCSTIKDSLDLSFASLFLCNNYTNCPDTTDVITALVESNMASQVYRAKDSLSSNAVLPNRYYEFTAGLQIKLNSGFSVPAGQVFVADIKNCNQSNN